MTLSPGDLNDLDEQIIEYLREHERASPTVFKREENIDTSRQWISSRFVRLEEHDHLRELYDTGVYELVADPYPGHEALTKAELRGRVDELEEQLEDVRAEIANIGTAINESDPDSIKKSYERAQDAISDGDPDDDSS